MLIRKKNNGGFTLVEVIVSMLVLSITIVSVLTAFSLSAKSNARTKQIQSAESLMEDLLELAGAVRDTGEYVDTCKTLFSGTVSVIQELSDSQPVQISQISGVKKGLFEYTVKITRDTKPAQYSNMNNQQVISFGATGSNSVLIDASLKGNDPDEYGNVDNTNEYDATAVDTFYTLHCNRIQEDNAQELLKPEEDRLPPRVAKSKEEVRDLIDRDILLVAEQLPEDKMRLRAYMTYKVPDGDDELELPPGVERTLQMEFYTSAVFDMAGSTTEGAEKLDRIYVLYSPWAEENLGLADNYDVRIWDEFQVLGADIFLIYQEDSIQGLDSTLVAKELDERSGTSKKIKVSFAKDSTSVQKEPYRVGLYSSAKIQWSGSMTNVTAKENSLISESEEIRVEELKIQVLDPKTGKELASGEIACLQ